MFTWFRNSIEFHVAGLATGDPRSVESSYPQETYSPVEKKTSNTEPKP